MKTLTFLTLVALMSNVALALPPTLQLSWLPVTTMADGTLIPSGIAVTYNVYGGHSLTGSFTLATTVSTTATTRSNVDIGLDCYKVTAVANTVESVATPAICITVTQTVSIVPGSPLNLVVTQTQ